MARRERRQTRSQTALERADDWVPCDLPATLLGQETTTTQGFDRLLEVGMWDSWGFGHRNGEFGVRCVFGDRLMVDDPRCIKTMVTCVDAMVGPPTPSITAALLREHLQNTLKYADLMLQTVEWESIEQDLITAEMAHRVFPPMEGDGIPEGWKLERLVEGDLVKIVADSQSRQVTERFWCTVVSVEPFIQRIRATVSNKLEVFPWAVGKQVEFGFEHCVRVNPTSASRRLAFGEA